MYNYGYMPNPSEIQAYAESLNNAYGDDVAQLVATDDGRDSFLWRALVPLLLRCDSRIQQRWLYKNGNYTCLRAYNQGQIGSCVGNAESMVCSIEQAIDIVCQGRPMQLTTMIAPEACYALGREAGNMLGNQDGCYGAAVAKALTTMGTLYQQKYDSVDLSDYSVDRCRQWGARGLPAELKPVAAQTKLETSYQIKTIEEAWSVIGAGHPINQCSNLGFQTTRDEDGALRPAGQWGHSMALIGRRTTSSGRKLFICMNSWGETWVNGPLYEDQPQGSFGIDYDVVAKAVAQGDMFVKIGMNGLKRRSLDWSNV